VRPAGRRGGTCAGGLSGGFSPKLEGAAGLRGRRRTSPVQHYGACSDTCCFAFFPIARRTFLVMAGLDPAIHAMRRQRRLRHPATLQDPKGNALYCLAFMATRRWSTRPIAWMAGSSPATTPYGPLTEL
jgi:hypothetical protein